MISNFLRFLRRRWPILLVTFLALIVAAVALFLRAITPVTPSDFYTPPDPLPADAAAHPGTIIRSEVISEGLPQGAAGWRILYSSTGVNGDAIAVSGVVAAPAAASDGPRPMLAFAQGTIGNLPQCGISQTTTPFAGIPQIDTMIHEGYIVVATDYPGRGTPGIHPYLVGRVAAASVLDALRAARQLDINASDRFVVWGRSQGGNSSLWTAQVAAGYAPELSLVAAAASAPAIDLKSILEYGMNSPKGAIVITYALAAWSHYFDGIDLDPLVRPELRGKFDGIANTCLTTPAAFLLLGELPTPSEYLAGDPFELEAVNTLIEENTPSGPIDVPLLIAHGTADSLIPIAGSEAAFAQRCAAGEDVQLVRYPGIGHDAAEESALMTIGWFDDRIAGRATGSNCDN